MSRYPVMEWLGPALFAVIIICCGVWAYARYREHARQAQERSLAALNRLLREADEIQQEKLRAEGIEPEQLPDPDPVSDDPKDPDPRD